MRETTPNMADLITNTRIGNAEYTRHAPKIVLDYNETPNMD